MGVPWTSYIPSPAAPGTLAFRAQVLGLALTRKGNSPIYRLLRRRVKKDIALGSTGGGGADGSDETPYMVRHGADLATLLAAIFSTGNMCVELHALDEFDAAGGAWNYVHTQANCTIDSYGGANDGQKAILSGFFVDDGTGWTSIGSGAYSKTFSGQLITGVRKNDAPDVSLEVGLETVFTRCATTAQVQGIASGYGFFDDRFTTAGSTTVTVKSNGAAPSAGWLQLCIGTGAGITINQADQCRLNALCIMGFGPGDGNALNGPVVVDIGSNKECVCARLSCWYGGKHCVSAVNSGAGSGALLLDNCKGGLCRHPQSYLAISAYTAAATASCTCTGHLLSTGDVIEVQSSTGTASLRGIHTVTVTGANTFTVPVNTTAGGGSAIAFGENKAGEMSIFVFYNSAGGHEGLGGYLEATYGTIPNYVASTLQPARRGALGYAHAGGGAARVGFVHYYGCTTKNHTYGCKSNITIGDAPDITTHQCNLSTCRASVFDDTFEGGDGTAPALNSAHVVFFNLNWRFKLDAGWTTATPIFGQSVARKLVMFNFFIQVDWSGITASGIFRWWSESAADDPVTLVRGHIRNIGKVGSDIQFDPNDSAVGTTNVRYNRCFDVVVCTTNNAHQYASCVLAPNVQAGLEASDTPTGGYRRSIFWNDSMWAKANTGSPPGAGAYWGCNSAAAGNQNMLAAAPEPAALATPGAGDVRYQTGSPAGELPFSLEHDVYWRTIPATPSAGPVQPLPGVTGGVGVAIGAGIGVGL